MVSGTQNQDISEKIEVIIQAAQKVFGEYGFEKASMNDIARELNFSKASLYYYFQDKESLFKSVIQKELKEFIRLLNEIIDKDLPASDQLRAYVDLRHHYFKIFLNLSKLRMNDPANKKSFMHSIISELKEKEVKLVDRIFNRGVMMKEFMELDPTETTNLFMDIIRGLRLNVIKHYNLNDIATDPESDLLKKMHAFTTIFIQGIKN